MLPYASPVEGGILGFMGEAGTVLTSVKEGDVWRVQIAWPNVTTKCFGKFGSEQEARKWISGHRRLTELVVEDGEIRRKPSGRDGRSNPHA